MEKRTTLNSRDYDVLDTLVHKVGILSAEQIGREWFRHYKHQGQSTRNLVRRFVTSKLVSRILPTVHPLIPLKAPVLHWSPGDPEPNHDAVSYRLKSRWEKEARRTSVILPTKEGVALLGGYRAPVVKPTSIRHDLHVGEVYFNLKKNAPETARKWKHEIELAALGWGDYRTPLPDALIDTCHPIAIDFGGSYPADKLGSMHARYSRIELSYQVW